MSNSTKIWLHSLAAAAIGGASGAGAAWFAAPEAFNFSHAGLIAFAKVIIASAAIPTFAYLKQSPMPALSVTSTTTESVEVTKN